MTSARHRSARSARPKAQARPTRRHTAKARAPEVGSIECIDFNTVQDQVTGYCSLQSDWPRRHLIDNLVTNYRLCVPLSFCMHSVCRTFSAPEMPYRAAYL